MDKKPPGKKDLYDVVIVGAGPVGLSLAISLVKMNLHIAVFEKKASTAEKSRAPSIWPKTQEILAQLGVIDAFLQEGIQIPILSLWDVNNKRVLFTAPIKELEKLTPYPQLLIIPQAQTEKILLENLKEQPTAEIYFSHEVTDLTQEESKVMVTCKSSSGKKQVSGKIVVGADGAHSIVREKIDAAFKGKTYPLKAALADVEIISSKNLHSPSISTKDGLAIGIRIKENTWRIILPISKKDHTPLADRIKIAVKNLFSECQWESVWQSDFNIHRKLSSHFVNGRVVLAGDAAHLNSPVGGQGMNAGIQDIPKLNTVIAEALTSNTTNPLSSFGKERRKEIKKGVNKFTDILTRTLLVFGRGRFFKPILWVGNLLMRMPPIRHKILKRMAMLE